MLFNDHTSAVVSSFNTQSKKLQKNKPGKSQTSAIASLFLLINSNDYTQTTFGRFILSISELGKASKLLLGWNNTEVCLSETALYKQVIFNRDSTEQEATECSDSKEKLKHQAFLFLSLPLIS